MASRRLLDAIGRVAEIVAEEVPDAHRRKLIRHRLQDIRDLASLVSTPDPDSPTSPTALSDGEHTISYPETREGA